MTQFTYCFIDGTSTISLFFFFLFVIFRCDLISILVNSVDFQHVTWTTKKKTKKLRSMIYQRSFWWYRFRCAASRYHSILSAAATFAPFSSLLFLSLAVCQSIFHVAVVVWLLFCFSWASKDVSGVGRGLAAVFEIGGKFKIEIALELVIDRLIIKHWTWKLDQHN